MGILKTLLGLDLPKAGTVKGKAIQPPASIDYGGIVGVKHINEKPIYWLAIQPKGGRKIRQVPVTKKQFDAVEVGDQWQAE